jgi:pyruvate kinase
VHGNSLALLRRTDRVVPGDKIVVATDIVAQDRLIDAVQLRTVR